MSALANAKPGDVFRDKSGQLYRVAWYCQTPTVGVEPLRTESDAARNPLAPAEMSGGIYGAMWDGFVKLEPKL